MRLVVLVLCVVIVFCPSPHLQCMEGRASSDSLRLADPPIDVLFHADILRSTLPCAKRPLTRHADGYPTGDARSGHPCRQVRA